MFRAEDATLLFSLQAGSGGDLRMGRDTQRCSVPIRDGGRERWRNMREGMVHSGTEREGVRYLRRKGITSKLG